jgi:uncharacterized membrane protein
MSNVGADKPEGKKFDDAQMEVAMGRLLQTGVLLASAVVLTGGVLYLRAQHGAVPNYRSFSSEPANLRQLSEMGHGIATGDPATIIQLGILLLIATPVARVAFALIAFAIERDKLYVAVSLTVLSVLLLSFFHAQ